MPTLHRPEAADLPRAGVSSCLLGEQVRYDGNHKRMDSILQALTGRVEWIPVCPEVEVGMGVPREPVRLVSVEVSPRMVGVESGKDWTTIFNDFSRKHAGALAQAGLDGYVFKARSPSCGVDSTERVDRAGAIVGRGSGLFAAAIQERLPSLPIVEESDLYDGVQIDQWVQRVEAHHTWRLLEASHPTVARLAAFHAQHAALLGPTNRAERSSVSDALAKLTDPLTAGDLSTYATAFFAVANWALRRRLT